MKVGIHVRVHMYPNTLRNTSLCYAVTSILTDFFHCAYRMLISKSYIFLSILFLVTVQCPGTANCIPFLHSSLLFVSIQSCSFIMDSGTITTGST
jgi:hypothetical protein